MKKTINLLSFIMLIAILYKNTKK